MNNAVTVSNDELATVREAMRAVPSLLKKLDAGEVEKVVLTSATR